MFRAALISLFLVAQSPPALAQASPPAAPRVIATTPSDGAVIKPGEIVLSVTFDRRMLPDHFALVRVSPETFPTCHDRPAQSADGKTFSLQCTIDPGRSYELWFNREPYMAFRSLEGAPAEPHRLVFAASTE